MTCRLDRLPKSKGISISLDKLPGHPHPRLRLRERSPLSSLSSEAVALAKATRRALRNECVFNRFRNAAGIVVMVPQRGQDPGGVHVLHFLVVLKGIAMDVG